MFLIVNFKICMLSQNFVKHVFWIKKLFIFKTYIKLFFRTILQQIFNFLINRKILLICLAKFKFLFIWLEHLFSQIFKRSKLNVMIFKSN